jgi:hypothetical protein
MECPSCFMVFRSKTVKSMHLTMRFSTKTELDSKNRANSPEIIAFKALELPYKILN